MKLQLNKFYLAKSNRKNHKTLKQFKSPKEKRQTKHLLSPLIVKIPNFGRALDDIVNFDAIGVVEELL